MKYPVLIHKDKNSEFGATLPDIPGCFTTGRTIDEVFQNIQEAVICYYEGEDIAAPPEISKIEDLVEREDIYQERGFWSLVDIDFSFLSKKIVRINLTVPAYKLAMINRAAKKQGLSRSAFMVNAAEKSCLC